MRHFLPLLFAVGLMASEAALAGIVRLRMAISRSGLLRKNIATRLGIRTRDRLRVDRRACRPGDWAGLTEVTTMFETLGLVRVSIVRDGRYVDIVEIWPEQIANTDPDCWFSGWLSQYADCRVFVTPEHQYPQQPTYTDCGNCGSADHNGVPLVVDAAGKKADADRLILTLCSSEADYQAAYGWFWEIKWFLDGC